MKKSQEPLIHIIEDDIFYANALKKTLEPKYTNVEMYHSGEEVMNRKGKYPI